MIKKFCDACGLEPAEDILPTYDVPTPHGQNNLAKLALTLTFIVERSPMPAPPLFGQPQTETYRRFMDQPMISYTLAQQPILCRLCTVSALRSMAASLV